MPLYEIPLWQRLVKLDPQTIHSKVTCLHIDEVGLFVYYDKEEQLDPNYIRRHLIGIKSTKCVIEACSVEEAVRIFFNQYQGALIGGEREETKALWICPYPHILDTKVASV